jgi:hypothetical protein
MLEYERTTAGITPSCWAMSGGAVMQGRTLSCLGMGEMKGPTKAAPNGRRHPGFDTVLLGTERPVIGVKQSWRS